MEPVSRIPRPPGRTRNAQGIVINPALIQLSRQCVYDKIVQMFEKEIENKTSFGVFAEQETLNPERSAFFAGNLRFLKESQVRKIIEITNQSAETAPFSSEQIRDLLQSVAYHRTLPQDIQSLGATSEARP